MDCLFRFGDFQLSPRERLLRCGNNLVPIAPKAFDGLLFLLENAGSLVDRTALREHLWPDSIVEEATLARIIADIRKALGDTTEQRRYIETVPKFGYRFVAPVERIPLNGTAPAAEEIPVATIPAAPSRVSRSWLLAAASFVIVVVAGAAIAARSHSPLPVQSLLIAPFQTIGQIPDADALRFGLQDSLTTELSALSELSVRSAKRTPSTDDAAQLGRDYHADFVLTGTVQISGERMRVNARILRSATGQALWTASFEEHTGDLLQIESSLAKRASKELLPVLSPKDGERLARRFPANAEAHRYYLLGRHYWNQRDQSSYLEAIKMFQKSADADPSFALAYTGMADTYLLLGSIQNSPLTEALPRATVALETAVKLDPDLGEAHATLGLIAESYEYDWNKAEHEFQTAIRIAPSYATAHHWYAEYLSMTGQFGLSQAEFDVARELDPVSPIILTDMAQLYHFRRDYARSLQTLDEVLKLDPSFHLAHTRKGYALMAMNRPAEALEEFHMSDSGSDRIPLPEYEAWAAAVAGKRQQALELLGRTEPNHPSAFLLGVVWGQLGDPDRAVQWLERGYEGRAAGFASLKVNPVFDTLRSNPKFQALLRKMNFN